MMDLIFWVLVFIFSLTFLIKGSDWLVESSEKIALAFKISPFIVGVTIVAIGTSFPELASSIAAVLKGETELVVSNVVGSNIANILLIVGLSAIAAGRLVVKRSLIDLDLPLLAATTGLFLFVIADKRVVFWEGMLLVIGFITYLLYTFFERKGEGLTSELVEILPEGVKLEFLKVKEEEQRVKEQKKEEKVTLSTFVFLIVGFFFLILGANYVIEATVKIANILKISPAIISITAIAVGTSLPELIVSVRAAFQKRYEISLGNIFGSNVFNIFSVAGIPALMSNLNIDESTFSVGIPFLIVTTLLFVISGISRRIHRWEGLMYVLMYLMFLGKLFNLF